MRGHLLHRLDQAGALLKPLKKVLPLLLEIFHLGPLFRRGGRRLNGEQILLGFRRNLWPFARTGFCRRRGQLPGANHQLAIFDAVLILEESTLRWAGSPRSIGIICATVAGAEEELGLLEPAHRATKMRTIDGKDLEFSIVGMTYPGGGLRGIAVAGSGDGIHVFGNARLTERKGCDGTESENQ